MRFADRLTAMRLALQKVLSRLSFRTGIIVLAMCIPFYIVSFAQMALPISAAWKTALWVVFFGLAKTAQYGGLTILGAEGIRRLRAFGQKRCNRHTAREGA